jgi:transcriptional regulator with XRE-family HTH domain
MNSAKLSFGQLRGQAIALRRAGKSRRQIQQILAIGSNATLNEALTGEPPPDWTRRPRAKDDLRARARGLREQGFDYEDIAARLGVSKSSVSLWVRDMPRPARLSYGECQRRSAEGVGQYWEAERPAREAQREAIRAAAAAEVGTLSEREIRIAGAIAYWCEGAKSKPYAPRRRVSFINSDPELVRLFLRFLEVAAIPRDRLTFRVYIHEHADIVAAGRFWAAVTLADQSQFRSPTLKRHNPRTLRKNVSGGYHGCLRIDVLRSSALYHQIEGWARAAMAQTTPGEHPLSSTGSAAGG